MKRYLSALGFAVLLLVPAEAQDTSRNSKRILELFGPVVEKPAACVVRVRCGSKDVALGTVVSADGWIITKYSELSDGELVVHFANGKYLPAKLVNMDDKYDLAALKVDAKDLAAVTWSDSKVAPVGRWVASAGPGKLPVAIGVIGVPARKLPGGVANPTPGYFGAGFDLDFAGVKVSEVTPKGPAQKAGVKVGDLIVTVNGLKVNDAEAFIALIQQAKPGDVLGLSIEREQKEQGLKVTLEKRPAKANRGDVQNSLGSVLSKRRTGFPVVLQHDCVVKPADCGGPLVDLDGRVVGINVARAGRTETYAIPGEVVVKLLPELKKTKEDKTKKDDTKK